MTMVVRDIAYDDPIAAALIAEVQQEYVSRYGGPDGTPLRVDEFAPPHGAFVIVAIDQVAIGCGGLRRYDDVSGEIKRMFVRRAHRRTGLGRRLLHALEDRARQLGYRRVILETGTAQPEAMSLYDSEGFVPIGAYGHHRCSPLSRSFAKDL